MNSLMHTMIVRALSAALCGTMLAACGGGGGSDAGDATAAAVVTDGSTASNIYAGRGTNTTPATTPTVGATTPTVGATTPTVGATTPTVGATTPTVGATTPTVGATTPVAAPTTPAVTTPVVPPVASAAITSIRPENSSTAAQANVPFTFGQVFAVGHLAKGASLAGRFDNGETVQLQVDAKAFHPDGSVRHAVISSIAPSIGSKQVRKLELVAGTSASNATSITPAQLLSSGFTASVNATIAGVRYSASADELLKAGKTSNWLSGATANEWLVSAPLKTANGVQHPHLTARFAVRWYGAVNKARVDVIVENNWAYEPSPSNFTYDAEVQVGGKSVYTKPALTHLHHARWRKVFWMGATEPDAVVVKHDTAYLIGTGAVANYDQTITVKESTLANMKSFWTGERTEIMNVGSAMRYMPTTGGREDIGLLPAWSVTYLLSMDARAKTVTLGNGDLAGSWSMHFRDKQTDKPVSIVDYPYMTILGRQGDTYNPTTKKYESFPACASTSACTTPFTHDTSHQPSLAYLPYLVTGDHYYLEELQFWAMWNVLSYHPRYREYSKGVIQSHQVRGQAWALRSLAEAAYITPDTDRLKSQFASFVNNSMAWYNTTYTDNPEANQLGVLLNQAFAYRSGNGVAPWQDDFFTSSVGHAAELGFSEAKRLLTWKAKYPVQRMNDGGLCWIDAAMYSMVIRDSSTGPIYSTMAQVAKGSQTDAVRLLECGSAAMAKQLNLKVGEMTGYSSSAMGYPSNMQPALAFSVAVSGANGKAAWAKFMARSVKPDYSVAPEFAIVPR